MKGMVMRAFTAFVEETWGDAVADSILSADGLSSAGAFTNVGYYPTSDMTLMVTTLATITGEDAHGVVRRFGEDLFHRLARGHAEMMKDFASPIAMLAAIESVIHVNVRKLYTDTELPHFDVKARDGDRALTLVYRSARPFADLAEGLIHGCLAHYGVTKDSSVRRHDDAADGTAATFTITVGAVGEDATWTNATRPSGA